MTRFGDGARLAALGFLLSTTCAVATFQVTSVDNKTMKIAVQSGEWLMHGHDFDEQRYSPLTSIDASNVARLRAAWSRELGPGGGNQWATPLFASGVLYTITNWSITVAVDARTGTELWRHDPQADRSTRLCCGVLSRGIALYEGKVIVPVIDGRLQALDAATGKLLWSSLAVPERKAGETFPYSITMAPRVANGKVFIGNAGAEFTPFRGYVAAFDVNDGRELWRFYSVPGDPSKPFENKAMALAAKTWSGEWWKMGGGGSMWDGMAYDPDLNLLYVGTGNGLPYPQDVRHGVKNSPRLDNLYVASILALDANTGQLKWHYQCTPGDQWDYDAVQHLILADLAISGRTRKVIMQANKNGYLYVLDRRSGQFISGEPMAPVSWARGLDSKTGRPLINAAAYYTSDRAVTLQPHQAHSASQMAFSPKTGLVYVPIAPSTTFTFLAADGFTPNPRGQDRGTVAAQNGSTNPAKPPAYGPVRDIDDGILSAWDPATQRERWFGAGGGHSGGGVLSTASNLVFQTTGGYFGKDRGLGARLVAYAADNGTKLLDERIGLEGVGPPITYLLDGKQYIAVMGGTGGVTNPRLTVYTIDAPPNQ